jgi:hypothetical protein
LIPPEADPLLGVQPKELVERRFAIQIGLLRPLYLDTTLQKTFTSQTSDPTQYAAR